MFEIRRVILFNIHTPLRIELSEGVHQSHFWGGGASQSASYNVAIFFLRVQHEMPVSSVGSRNLAYF